MFFGDYSFFDYKYNISGYSGQDFGGPGQHLYLALSVHFPDRFLRRENDMGIVLRYLSSGRIQYVSFTV